MPTPKEMYDLWLNAKDRVNTSLMRASSAKGDDRAFEAIDQLSESFNYFVELTRKVFNQDENRIKVRDATISHLQDQIANLQNKDLKG